MLNRTSILLATAAILIGAGAASADPYDRGQPNQNNANANDRGDRGDQNQPNYGNGYNYGYDDGVAKRDRNDRYRPEPYRHEAHYDRGAYYYGSDCSSDNATGTIIGAIAGGVIGGSVSHGNGGAVLGGVILGGLAGNTISSNMNCDDRRYAMTSYSAGFDGRIGERHDWRNRDGGYGTFTPTREYSRGGDVCRDFHETGYSNRRSYNRTGTACRHGDGNWYTD